MAKKKSADPQSLEQIQEEIKSKRKQMLRVGKPEVSRDLFLMLKARYKLLYIQTSEEDRIVDFLRNISISDGYEVYRWDLSRGLCDVMSNERVSSEGDELHTMPVALIDHILDITNKDIEINDQGVSLKKGGRVFILLDFDKYLDNALIQRKLKEFAKIARNATIVICSPVFIVPAYLEKEMTYVNFPYPSKDEIRDRLYRIVDRAQEELPNLKEETEKQEEALINASTGLTLFEADNAYAKCIVRYKTFKVDSINEEKRQIIRQCGWLEFCEPKFKTEDVGGLYPLIEWLLMRKIAFTSDAQEFGISIPKGALFCGTPGCGKSMVSEVAANLFNIPLLKLNMGAVFGSRVGESEDRMRRGLLLAESIAPCVLFLDEVEKGIGGVKSSSSTDGGTTNRVVAQLLTWMQDKTVPVFVVCTANNVTDIPPEFMRAGRFDEIFFVDLPDQKGRMDVFQKILTRKHKKTDKFENIKIEEIDLVKASVSTENYTPAEIEKSIDNALFIAYSDNKRKITTEDIISEAKKFSPLFDSRRDDIKEMRKWAIGENGKGAKARLANGTKKVESTFTEKQPDRALSLESIDGIV